MRCINKFWLENFKNLFCSFNLVPIIGESLEEQMNSLTRLVFVIFLCSYYWIINLIFYFYFYQILLLLLFTIYKELK